jgi:hypothetical protein
MYTLDTFHQDQERRILGELYVSIARVLGFNG